MNEPDLPNGASHIGAGTIVHEPLAVVAPSEPADSMVDASYLHQGLLRAVFDNPDKRAMLAAIGHLVSEDASVTAVYYFEDGDSNGPRPYCLIGGHIESASDIAENEISACAHEANAQGRLVTRRLDDHADQFVLAVPVDVPDGAPASFAVAVEAYGQSKESLVSLLEMAAAHITLWHVQHESTAKDFELRSMAAQHELLANMEACRDLGHACQTLVDELQKFVGCERLAVALCWGGRSRLQAISGCQKFDRHSQLASAMASTLDESILRDALTVWPPLSPGDRHAALAHHRLCGAADVQCVVSSPLRNQDGEAIGAWLFLGARQCFQQGNTLNFIRASESRVASCLALLKRARGGRFGQMWQSSLGSKRSWKANVTLAIVGVVLAALFLPVNYKIQCDCRLEPVSRRFVAAPYDGILEKTQVTTGATVSRGEQLARMDGREIRWELAGVTAERDGAVKKSDAAFANHKFAAASVASLEVDRLELKMRILEQRERNLDIKSPISGVVTVGDLDKAQGAPVTCGQTLFEIAPLEQMTVEVAIPQSELPYVRSGQPMLIYLEACPKAPFHASIVRLHPRSEIRGQQNVFIAEATLRNESGDLRPGMQGRAKITGPRRSLAWNLFHKPWEALCLALGW